MLQIKNALGGGKPEGLYVWKKNNYAFTEKSTSGMTVNTFITTEAQNKSIKYYYSSSYSYDDNTGLFVLENPTSNTIPYGAGVSPPANVYITVFSPSSEIMIKTPSTSGKSTLYNVSAGVYFHTAKANYPYTLFKSEITLSFLDYIVSDKETAYPNGGEKGGYWYEKVNGISGTDKIIFDTANQLIPDDVKALSIVHTEEITLASDSNVLTHSYGQTPYHFILTTEDFDWSSAYVYAITNITYAIIGINAIRKYLLSGEKTIENGVSGFIDVSSTYIKNTQSSYRFIAGHTYKLYVFA